MSALSLIPILRDGRPSVDIALPAIANTVSELSVRVYEQAGFQEPWIAYFAELDGEVVGTCAFKSPPANGRVEIAYFTFPEHEGRGIATAMASGLVLVARKHAPDVTVAAQTLPEYSASTAILQKLGFTNVGVVQHPDDGPVWEWQLLATEQYDAIHSSQKAFEQVWEYREEVVYRSLFGDIGSGVYTLSPDIFTEVFRQEEIDPRWMFYGVFECPPHAERNSWLYISSGLSNPWDDNPDEYTSNERSGLGVEFAIETDVQAEWAIVMLQRMIAFNLLIASGRFGTNRPLALGDRIPLNGSVALDQPSALRNLVIARAEHYTPSFVLPSGHVDILHFIGITDTELAFAQAHGSDVLVECLKKAGVFPLTKASRNSIVLPA